MTAQFAAKNGAITETNQIIEALGAKNEERAPRERQTLKTSGKGEEPMGQRQKNKPQREEESLVNYQELLRKALNCRMEAENQKNNELELKPSRLMMLKARRLAIRYKRAFAKNALFQ